MGKMRLLSRTVASPEQHGNVGFHRDLISDSEATTLSNTGDVEHSVRGTRGRTGRNPKKGL